MKNKRLVYNTISSLIFQITTLICGFILPRLILQNFGSEINGLVNSITQFLNIIAFLELGVGAVVQSSLYKPLADNDTNMISKIVVSAVNFFKLIARILFVYIIVLILAYPYIANQNFGWMYTACLIVAMGISSFSQYYFGVVDRLLLTADQRGFIQYTAQSITLVMNTLASIYLIKVGASIHVIKLASSLIYFLRPCFLRLYVDRNYAIDRNITYSEEPIKQKWNGVAQHIAAVVLDGTDNIVLTVFSTLSNVSIYSLYHLVICGVKQLFMSMTNGIQSLIGELWAKQKLNELNSSFGWFEWLIHTGTILVFGCTGVLILPFIQVYTSGIDDANYIQPLFAMLITIAHAGHCLRLPYSIMILAGGHYKQTQNYYVIAAVINIIVSIITVRKWGLIGVALGTLAAMLFHTIWMSRYTSTNLIRWPFTNILKQFLVDGIIATIGIMATCSITMERSSYLSWIFLAIRVGLIWFAVSLIINLLFYKEKVIKLKTVLYKHCIGI